MTSTTKIRDELGEQIITAGLAESDFILDLNGGLTVPSGFPLPPLGICHPVCFGPRSRYARCEAIDPARSAFVTLI